MNESKALSRFESTSVRGDLVDVKDIKHSVVEALTYKKIDKRCEKQTEML
jgi:hypothetical protein